MKTRQVSIAVIALVVILLALWRIGASAYDYALWKIDHDSPTIPLNAAPPPLMHAPELPRTLPPHEEQKQSCCDPNAMRNQIIRI